ncbi:MAG: phosphogluconate dehydratase [Pseudomonadota bacterium]
MTKAPLNPKIAEVLERIERRSRDSREAYLEMVRSRRPQKFARKRLSEANQAHASAGCTSLDKLQLLGESWPNVGIVTAYNDMLSAHAPYETYPEQIRTAAREVGATAQVSGGVPAMCDGVTQGQDGMDLSLFSRDVIALASAVSLSHDAYDGLVHLGICDKIVPGLTIAALRFGWLPSVFIPGGPMPSGLSNPEKARIRQEFAEGKVDRQALLEAESQSYHSPGTCTFYGTANSNQMMMEVMGLHLPGAAFVNPNTPLRDALTKAATQKTVALSLKGEYTPMGEMIDARSFVNAMVGLMATGGSTNHALHIPAMAAAAGLEITLDDFDDISSVTPLLCRIYPNGIADVNHFHAAGGMGFLVRELINHGVMIGDAVGISGPISAYDTEPYLKDGTLAWRPAPEESGDLDVLRPAGDPFQADGGLRLVSGAIGRGVSKVSAVKPENRVVEAPARVFDSQQALKDAFAAGELNGDLIAVVRFQGPTANGMPELHAMTPVLGVLQDRGHRVALVTDGRMSGASGKVPSAIHIAPEAAVGGPIAKLQDGDVIRLDPNTGELELKVDQAEFEAREAAPFRSGDSHLGLGREMFDSFRGRAGDSESGASLFRFLAGAVG